MTWAVYRDPDGKPIAELSFFVPKDCRIVLPDFPTREAASKAATELREHDAFAAALDGRQFELFPEEGK